MFKLIWFALPFFTSNQYSRLVIGPIVCQDPPRQTFPDAWKGCGTRRKKCKPRGYGPMPIGTTHIPTNSQITTLTRCVPWETYQGIHNVSTAPNTN
jgi:hypothetical protein